MSYRVSKIFFPAQQGYGRTCLLHTFQGQAKKTLEQFWLQLAEEAAEPQIFLLQNGHLAIWDDRQQQHLWSTQW
jgi:ATP/maltotriose-dependent transcriptional regulator MalT